MFIGLLYFVVANVILLFFFYCIDVPTISGWRETGA